MLSASGTSENVCRYTCAQMCPVKLREGLQFCRTDRTGEHYPLACCCSLWSSTASASLHNQEKITLFFFQMLSPGYAEHVTEQKCCSHDLCLPSVWLYHVNMAGPFSPMASSRDAFQRESPSSYAKAEIMPSSKHNSNKAPLSYHQTIFQSLP